MRNNAPLVVFRGLFGLLMAIESLGAIATGWVHKVYVTSHITFPILTTEWPYANLGSLMLPWFVVMGIAGILVMVGWHYYLSTTALAILWTIAYLGQKTYYNNHYYLAAVLCWVMVFMPTHHRAALDVGRRVPRALTCPAWIHTAFKFQLLIVFSFAAVAKFNTGWLSGDFLSVVLLKKDSIPILGPLLVQAWFQKLLAYSGIVFDAIVIPALWYKRTRPFAFGGLIFFNLFNSIVFQIGIFPYLVLAWTVFFFEPKTIERVFAWIPGLVTQEETVPSRPKWLTHPQLMTTLLIVYFTLQMALPLRHHLITGDVTWTEEGHRMSWRMMLRVKSGVVRLLVRDSTSGQTWIVPQQQWLSRRQRNRIATTPDALYQFIQFLKDHYRAEGHPNIQIFAIKSFVSLNGGPYSPLYDPEIDLTKVKYYGLRHNSWILLREEESHQ